MLDTGIEWAHHTINQYIGCTGVSPGCDNCYAEAIESRFGRNFSAIRKSKAYESGDLGRMLGRIQPSRIFADSMFDYFHESFTYQQIRENLSFLDGFPQHQFLILTKRIGRAWDFCRRDVLPKNVWLGTSVESNRYLWRIDTLRKVPATIRFISFEPLLEEVRPDLTDIDWAIVGGESGPRHRPFRPEWAITIRDACMRHKAKFFFKQHGGLRPTSGGRMLDGRTYDEVPVI